LQYAEVEHTSTFFCKTQELVKIWWNNHTWDKDSFILNYFCTPWAPPPPPTHKMGFRIK
jgi:hypothetical protein